MSGQTGFAVTPKGSRAARYPIMELWRSAAAYSRLPVLTVFGDFNHGRLAMKALKRIVRPEESGRTVFAHAKAMPAASRSSEREAVSPSRLEELSSDDDTRNDSKASPVQREYTREQELIAWALIIVILVISVIAFYLLWAKANGTV